MSPWLEEMVVWNPKGMDSRKTDGSECRSLRGIYPSDHVLAWAVSNGDIDDCFREWGLSDYTSTYSV